jgi:hypothetical protein
MASRVGKNNAKALGSYGLLPICVCSYCAVLKQRVGDMGVPACGGDMTSRWY